MTDHNDTTPITPSDDAPAESVSKHEPHVIEAHRKAEPSDELQRFWEAVKRLPAYVRLSAAILRDPDLPRDAKIRLGIGGGYALSPIDLVPGIIPVAGQMDDLYAVLTGLKYAIARLDEVDAQRHLDAAGIRSNDIDNDLKAIRDVAKMAVVKTARTGGKAVGRFSRATFRFANNQLKRRNTTRSK